MPADPTPLFCGVELAARIERAEAELCAEATRNAVRREVRGAFVAELGGGFATRAGCDVPYNKVAGLGFAGAIGEPELQAVEALYADEGTPVRVELSSLAEPSIAPLLSGRGYVLQGFENVLGRRLPAQDAGTPEVDVRQGTAADTAAWIETMVEGFAHPDEQGVPSDESFPRGAVEDAMKDMRAVDGFSFQLAYRGGELAGGAGLRLCRGVAQLCGAATLPRHRRRGVQSTLLARRLDTAARQGCDVAVVTTQPGSKSQQNAQGRGFSLLYVRAVLVRPVP